MNLRRALLAASLVLPGLWVLAMGFGRDPHAVPTVLVGRPLPAFATTTVAGEAFDSAALAGKPALINFWASWCFPCQAEHGLLQALARTYAGELTVLGIIYQDGTAQINDYLDRHPSPYPHLRDPEATMAMDFGVAGVPETFFVDAHGTIVAKHAGALTPVIVERTLLPLLRQGSAHAAP